MRFSVIVSCLKTDDVLDRTDRRLTFRLRKRTEKAPRLTGAFLCRKRRRPERADFGSLYRSG
jgi:hypothetical protein